MVRLPKAQKFCVPFSIGKGFFVLGFFFMFFLLSSRAIKAEESVLELKANTEFIDLIRPPSLIWLPPLQKTSSASLSGASSVHPIPIKFDQDSEEILVVHSPKEVTYDENPESSFWISVPEFSFANHKTQLPSSASVKIQWDENHLYLLFDIKDSYVEHSSDAWDGDSVSIILRNKESDIVYRYRYDIQGTGEGQYQGKLILKEGTTVDDNSNIDKGFWVLLKIRWTSLKFRPYDGAKIPFNLISVNHNGQPGARHNDPGVEFSKVILDRGSADTTRRNLTLIADVPAPITSPIQKVNWENVKPNYDKAEKALSYILSQQDSSTGLFRSYNRENISHTYDQALVLADIVAEMEAVPPQTGRFKTLERYGNRLANVLVELQNPDGSWFNAYDASSKRPLAREKYIGVISWVTYSLARLANVVGNETYAKAALRGSEWLKAQYKNGALIHQFKNGSEVAITEANINAWYALQLVGEISMARKIQHFLMTRLWCDTEGRFFAGLNINNGDVDQDAYLDNQALGAYFLKLTGEHQKAQRALKYALQNFTIIENGAVKGLDGRPSKLAVWIEGSFYYILAEGPNSQKLLAELNKHQTQNGAFPHDTKEIKDPWHTQMLGVNATVWAQQANLGTHLLKLPNTRLASLSEKKEEIRS